MLAGQEEVADMLHMAKVARTESVRAEQNWNLLESFRVNQLCRSPASVTAVQELSKLLSERAFRHTSRLRAALQPLEKLLHRMEALHTTDLHTLTARLQAEHMMENTAMCEELAALETEVQLLRANVAQKDARIAHLESAYANVQAARRTDAQRLQALVPEGYKLVSTDDAEFNEGLAARLAAQSRAQKNMLDAELSAIQAKEGWEPEASYAQVEAHARYLDTRRYLDKPKAIRVWRRHESLTIHCNV